MTSARLSMLFVTCCLVGCDPNSRAEQIAQRAQQQRTETIRAFAALNAADYEWKTRFENLERLRFHSLELQRTLMGSTGRRIAIDAILDDIAIGEDGSHLVFAHASVGWLGPTIHLRLKSDESLVETLLEKDNFSTVLLVMSLERIWRPLVSAEQIADRTQIAVDTRELIGTGTLIAAKRLEN